MEALAYCNPLMIPETVLIPSVLDTIISRLVCVASRKQQRLKFCLFPVEPIISRKRLRVVAGGYLGFCIIEGRYA